MPCGGQESAAARGCARTPPMDTVVVVEYELDEPLSIDGVEAMETRNAWCLAAHRVRHLQSYLSFDGRRLVCIFAAHDVESARIAAAKIGAPVTRLYGATLHGEKLER